VVRHQIWAVLELYSSREWVWWSQSLAICPLCQLVSLVSISVPCCCLVDLGCVLIILQWYTQRQRCCTFHGRSTRPSATVPSLLPLRESGTCYHRRSLYYRHCRLSSMHWRRNCLTDRTTTHTSGNSSIDTSLIRDIYCDPEVLFETCVAMKFVDDDDDDDTHFFRNFWDSSQTVYDFFTSLVCVRSYSQSVCAVYYDTDCSAWLGVDRGRARNCTCPACSKCRHSDKLIYQAWKLKNNIRLQKTVFFLCADCSLCYKLVREWHVPPFESGGQGLQENYFKKSYSEKYSYLHFCLMKLAKYQQQNANTFIVHMHFHVA